MARPPQIQVTTAMPPLPLTSLLQTALPGLSANGRAVISALGCFNGDTHSPAQVATLVGMRSRFQLARALRREGLPPLGDLAAWARVLYWVQESEATGASLFKLARRDHLDPAAAYRLVRRTTRLYWSEVRRAGLAAMARRLRERCRSGLDAAHTRDPARARRPASLAVDSPCNGNHDAGSEVPGTLSRRPSHPRGELAHRLIVPGYPFDVGLAPDGLAWLTCTHAAAVECLRLDPLSLVASVRTGAVPTRIALTTSGELAYVTNQFTEEVGILDLRQRRQIGTIPVPGNPLGAVLSLDDRILYVTTNLDQLHAIWLPTGRVVASVPIHMACTSLLLHPSGTRLFVPTFRAGLVVEVDARTLRTIRTFHVGGVVHELACTPDGLRLHATNEEGWLDVIHLTTEQRITLRLGTMAHGLALSPDGAVVYVGLLRAGKVAVIDRGTLAVVATIATGGKPRRITFRPSGRAALVTNENGWVDLVH